MNKTIIAIASLLVVMFVLAAFSHRVLPVEMDECQRDVTHAEHNRDLPPFHCIGHSEFDPEAGTWDHLHPWMTEEWHAEHGVAVESREIRE